MGVFALGYAMYYGLQAFGVEPGMAGNWVQLVVVLALMVGWLASYLLRVANKVLCQPTVAPASAVHLVIHHNNSRRI